MLAQWGAWPHTPTGWKTAQKPLSFYLRELERSSFHMKDLSLKSRCVRPLVVLRAHTDLAYCLREGTGHVGLQAQLVLVLLWLWVNVKPTLLPSQCLRPLRHPPCLLDKGQAYPLLEALKHSRLVAPVDVYSLVHLIFWTIRWIMIHPSLFFSIVITKNLAKNKGQRISSGSGYDGRVDRRPGVGSGSPQGCGVGSEVSGYSPTVIRKQRTRTEAGKLIILNASPLEIHFIKVHLLNSLNIPPKPH